MTQAVSATTAGRRLELPLAIDARRAAGLLSLIGIVATGFLVVAGAAGEPSSFVPGRKGGYPGWLHEPLSSLDLGLGAHWVVFAILAMWGFYGLALVFSDAISTRHGLTAIVTLHGILLLGPPLLSLDVFSYIEYGRLGALHGLNPYVHSPSAVPHDAAFPFIGWYRATSVYGPVFTLGTYATAPLGVGGALWAMKAVTVGASLGCVALVWKAAERLGRRPLEAAMFFGLNPLLLVYAVGGVHNDVLMLALALGGIVLVLDHRERAGGLAAVGAAAVKASSGILLPYMLIGARRRGPFVVGALAAVAAAAAIWTIAFHAQVGPFLDTLRWEQDHGSLHSVPKALGSLTGVPVGSHWVRLGLNILLVVAVALTLLYAHRRGEWLVAAGWGTFALLVTTAWLLPWYVIWILPIAAMTGDRKLRIATLVLSAFVIGMRIPFWLG
jgi:alpha-1,6-mannosyltransferase